MQRCAPKPHDIKYT